MEERITSADKMNEDNFEKNIRPESITEYRSKRKS